MQINVNQPTHTGMQYFTPEEARHIEEFLATETETGRIYVNAAGERVRVLRIFLPYGVITKDTTSFHGDVPPGYPDGTYYYHTPCAKRVERNALLNVAVEGGPQKQMTSGEWLKWLGGGWESEAVPEVPPTVVPASIIKAQEDARAAWVVETSGTKKPEGEAKPEEPVWRSASKRQNKKSDKQ